MRVALFGSGGREHALAWRMMQDSVPPQITCFPGNPGMGEIAVREPMENNLHRFAEQLAGRFDLAVIGPEALLEKGWADRLRGVGIPTFGAGAHAARIETSKFFAKGMMDQLGVLTPRWRVVTHIDAARIAICQLGGPPIVLKADGTCAGKGAFVCNDVDAVEEALAELFTNNTFGAAAQLVLVEEKIVGVEASYIGLANGLTFEPLACSMDYKQALAGDKGPNTGGMGAHSPSFVLNSAQLAHMKEVMSRVVRALFGMGRQFRGALYAGLMITPDGRIYILEFNARFGDPETQVLMMRLKEDLAPLLYRAATGALQPDSIAFSDEVAVCVSLTSKPYPKAPVMGEHILGLAEAAALPGVQIFHAGTVLQEDGTLVTAGGRVLSVCAKKKTLHEALAAAYAAAHRISWLNKDLRGDIGCRVAIKTAF